MKNLRRDFEYLIYKYENDTTQNQNRSKMYFNDDGMGEDNWHFEWEKDKNCTWEEPEYWSCGEEQSQVFGCFTYE